MNSLPVSFMARHDLLRPRSSYNFDCRISTRLPALISRGVVCVWLFVRQDELLDPVWPLPMDDQEAQADAE